MKNLKKILTLYDFAEPNFATALYKLLIAAITFHHPKVSKEEIDHKLSNPDEIQLLNYLIYNTQQYFFARLDERWEQFVPMWIEANQQAIYDYCTETKICDAIYPKEKYYDAVAIFGANKSEVFRRYRFLLKLLKDKQIKIRNRIYLLTGHRKLTPRIDGSENYLQYLADKYQKPLFETQMMLDLYDKFNFSQVLGEKVKLSIIDTGIVKNRRPNTYDTLLEMKRKMDKSDKKLLFISRSPVILEQKAAVKKVFDEEAVKYEVVGGECKLSEVRDMARASYHVLMSIAGTLYENYLFVAKKLNKGKYDAQQLEAFKSSLGYRNSPIKEVVFSDRLCTSKVER